MQARRIDSDFVFVEAVDYIGTDKYQYFLSKINGTVNAQKPQIKIQLSFKKTVS